MDKGWIKLHRRMQDHWLYPIDRTFTDYEAWQDILLSVNYKSKKVRIKNNVFKCGRGESLRSIKSWARRWNWSKSKVYRFFKLLEDENMIKTKSETLTTRLTVCNYDTYQDKQNADETEAERRWNADETEAYPNKKGNKGKKEKKEEEGDGKPSAIPELSEVKDYFKKNGYDPNVAEKAFNYYNASVEDTRRQYWRDSNGNKVRNWKMKMRAVWFKDENKISKRKKSPFRPNSVHI